MTSRDKEIVRNEVHVSVILSHCQLICMVVWVGIMIIDRMPMASQLGYERMRWRYALESKEFHMTHIVLWLEDIILNDIISYYIIS